MKSQNPKIAYKNNSTMLIALVLTLIFLFSFISALVTFADGTNEEELDVSEVVAESSEEESSEVVSEYIPPNEYKYYDSLSFRTITMNNSEVVNGSLAIVKDGSNGYPKVNQADIVTIGAYKDGKPYGLSNMSLVLVDEAIFNIDKFIVSFYEQVPKNGLIINRGYTSADAISPDANFIDLTSGYSVQFSIYNSSYKFSDVEFGYLRDQAYRYGVIQRYPVNKEEYTMHDSDSTIYRYVGLAHSMYMNHYNHCLEEYIDKIRTVEVIEYESELETDTAYVIYYVALNSEGSTTEVPVPDVEGYEYAVSGDGNDGFIVTVKVPIE